MYPLHGCCPQKDCFHSIRVDFKSLNASVIQDVHQLSTVDENTAQLHVLGAKIFSKLDANSGFRQSQYWKFKTTTNHIHHTLWMLVVL